MAAKKLGNDYMLWVESTVAGTYNVIGGQGNVGINRSSTKIDTSSKDDLGYSTAAYGLRDLTIDLMVKPKLPDASGYTRLETLVLASPAASFNIQIRKNGINGVSADSVLTCNVFGNMDSSMFNQNAVAEVKFSFTAAAAPTVDLLA